MASKKYKPPIVISTWYHGKAANEAASKILLASGSVLDAVEKGAAESENNPDVMDVGYGGLPDEDGIVTLDAAVMGPDGRIGSVAGLQDVKNAAAIARKVMESTAHSMIVGEGAKKFALTVVLSRIDSASRSLFSPSANSTNWKGFMIDAAPISPFFLIATKPI